MIAHKGSVVASWYAPHFDPINTHILYSVSKSVTATVAGILQHQGLLDPASPVSDYLPIPAESAYSDCTVQHVLDMTVALDFEEIYSAGAQDFSRYRNASGWDPVDDGSPLEGLRQFIFGLGKLGDQHGRIFRYRSPNSDLLGMILTSSSGSTFPELMGNLKGKFSIDLKYPYRLLITPLESISKTEISNEVDRWKKIKEIEIHRIENTHD